MKHSVLNAWDKPTLKFTTASLKDYGGYALHVQDYVNVRLVQTQYVIPFFLISLESLNSHGVLS